MPILMPLLAASCVLSALAQAPVTLWPYPSSMVPPAEWGGNASLSPGFTITAAAGGLLPDPLPAAVDRYYDALFFAGAPVLSSGPVITGLVVTVTQELPLKLGVDESYTLTMPAGGVATLTAATQWGALRGLETFTQFFIWSGNDVPTAYVTTMVPSQVVDAPRFPWRGLLIDSSRHFLTLAAIKATLDAMSMNKLNTLHWHLIDDQSWSLESITYPLFTEGAYAIDAIYGHAEVAEVVQYAFERGIRVIPEFDVPAHAAIWGKGYPNLTISCAGGQTLLNPTDDGGVYEVIDGLLSEFGPLFYTADTVHFGGDEVSDLTCWEQSPEVQAFNKAKGLADANATRNYFETRVQAIANTHNMASMFWEEVFDKHYDMLESSIVDVWLSYDEVQAAVDAGHPVVISFGLYLDQQTPYGGTHYFWGDTWMNFWNNSAPFESPLILGESLSQWGEQVDSANIQSRVWPRACGGAERMWAPKSLSTPGDLEQAISRLERQRCHMLQRGIGAGPLRPASDYVYCPLPGGSRFNTPHDSRAPGAYLHRPVSARA